MHSTKVKIAIIILNWNGKQDTLSCLASLQHVDYPNAEIIVVDNGSSDGSADAIRAHFPTATILENTENLGFAEGNNIGIRYALQTDAELILLLNNDTEVDPSLLDAFATCFENHPEAGILGAKICLFNQRDTLDHWGGNWNLKKGKFDFIGLRLKDQSSQDPFPIDYVCGAALIARRAVFETAGLLDPRFFLIWEESDFCFRARRAGFQTLSSPDAKIYHKVSASFVGKPHSTYFWWRNRLLWIERNCTTTQRLSLYLRVLLPDIAHMLKIRLLKTAQIKVQKKLQPQRDFSQHEEKLLKNRAALQGVFDYARRRFGNCPSWIYQIK